MFQDSENGRCHESGYQSSPSLPRISKNLDSDCDHVSSYAGAR